MFFNESEPGAPAWPSASSYQNALGSDTERLTLRAEDEDGTSMLADDVTPQGDKNKYGRLKGREMQQAPIPRHSHVIIVLASLLTLQGIFELVLAALVLSGSVAPVSGVAEASLAWGLFVLLLAWGVWRLKPWSFWIVVVLQVLTLGVAVVDVLELHSGIGSLALVVIGNILIPLVVLLLFWRNRLLQALLRS